MIAVGAGRPVVDTHGVVNNIKHRPQMILLFICHVLELKRCSRRINVYHNNKCILIGPSLLYDLN